MTDQEMEDLIDAYLGKPPRVCGHPWRHTVYGSTVRGKNGTTCVICGARLS